MFSWAGIDDHLEYAQYIVVQRIKDWRALWSQYVLNDEDIEIVTHLLLRRPVFMRCTFFSAHSDFPIFKTLSNASLKK